MVNVVFIRDSCDARLVLIVCEYLKRLRCLLSYWPLIYLLRTCSLLVLNRLRFDELFQMLVDLLYISHSLSHLHLKITGLLSIRPLIKGILTVEILISCIGCVLLQQSLDLSVVGLIRFQYLLINTTSISIP